MWIGAARHEERRAIARAPLDAADARGHIRSMIAPVPLRSSSHPVRRWAEAALMVAASTLAGLALQPQWGSSAIDLLYLPAVLGAAITAGLGPALFAAAASALAYNFFFIAPRHTFLIESPNDLVTVLVLFGVALVTSQLAASVRRQARIAQDEAARNASIAGIAGHLLSCTSEAEVAQVAARDLASIFGCNAALISGGAEAQIVASAPAAVTLTPNDLAVAALVSDGGVPAGRGLDRALPTEWQFHPVKAGEVVIAVMALARNDGSPPVARDQLPLLGNLLDQVALALERGRLEAAASEFARIRERDQVRSVLLSSIGADISPRLQTIGDAVAELRRSGTGDKALLSSIGAEAARIERSLHNMLDLGPASDQRPLELGDVVIDLFRRQVTRASVEVHLTPKEYGVLAELAKHPGRVLSHAHLLRSVWGPAHEKQVDYLRVAIRGLRQKLETDSAQPALILNEPAVGYRINAR